MQAADDAGRGAPGRRRLANAPPTLGWREWVELPDLCATPIKAKVDTGARTSSLHAFGLEIDTRSDGSAVAVFEIHPLQRAVTGATPVRAEVREFRRIRSSSGHSELRPVIATRLLVGPYEYEIDLTLTARDEMGFRMLLGRAAVRRRFLVDPGRSYRQGRPPESRAGPEGRA